MVELEHRCACEVASHPTAVDAVREPPHSEYVTNEAAVDAILSLCRFSSCADYLAALEAAQPWDSAARRAACLQHEREARRRDLTDATRSSASAKANKQGAYGKVPTHGHSKLDQLTRPYEVAAGLYVKLVPGALQSNLKPDRALDADLHFCDVKLGEVSRSFAAVIRQVRL